MSAFDMQRQKSRGILGFGTWVRRPPQISGVFLFGGGGIPPPIVTNPDVISKAYLFPSEGIEMTSGLIHQLHYPAFLYSSLYDCSYH
jgi:hypothetical protein